MKKNELEKIMNAEHELAAWYALHELNSDLGINVPATEYAMACQTNFFCYAENK